MGPGSSATREDAKEQSDTHIISRHCHNGSRQDKSDHFRKKEGHEADTAHAGIQPLDRLEVEGHVVRQHVGGRPEAEVNPGDGEDRSLPENTQRDHGSFTHPPLDVSKDARQQSGSDKETDHRRRAPGLRLPAPLQGQEETADGANEDDASQRIHVRQLLSQRKPSVLVVGAVDAEEDDEQGQDDGSDGNVSAKLPQYMYERRAASTVIIVVTINDKRTSRNTTSTRHAS